MYKVFFKDSSFLLTDDRNLLKEGTHTHLHQDFNQTKAFVSHLLEFPDKFTAVLFNEDVEELFSIFKSCFLYVKAAGGAVLQNDQVLVIKRAGWLDLPKGHVEHGETFAQCAVREVEEECGIQEVKIIAPLSSTLHLYYRDANWYLKKTYWYIMCCLPNPSLTPQTEEDIEEVFWLPLTKIPTILEQTYPSLKEVFTEIETKGHAVLIDGLRDEFQDN